jgi:protease YdgD
MMTIVQIRSVFCVLLSVLSLGAVGPVGAQPAGKRPEPRTRVDLRELPWRGIGKLQAVGGSLRMTCTAAVIGARTVLTAAHCLFNVRTQRNFPPSSLHFIAGFEGQTFAMAANVVDMLAGPAYDPARGGETRGSDWALVVLDRTVDRLDRVLALSLQPPAPGSAIMVGGYGQDNPNVLTADTSCRVLGYAVDALGQRLIRHDCAATHGVSGAPLLIHTDAGWSVGGIAVAQSATRAVGLAVTLERVGAVVAAAKGRFD